MTSEPSPVDAPSLEPDVEAAVRTFPAWATATLTIRPLAGGITNRNYIVRVTGDPTTYVVRFPGERTEMLAIDRTYEIEAARRGDDLGIGPPVTGVLPATGTLITELLAGGHLDTASFTARLDEVVPLLAAFHGSGPIGGRFPIHRVVEWHARDAAADGVTLPAVYDTLHEVSLRIEAAFARSPEPPVPCHNDLLPSNVLFDAGRVWLLDYEYAGMNDRYFDLGNLSINCGLDAAADERLLTLYFGAATPRRWARLQLMKVMSELREGMWAVVQQAISTLDTDFAAYADDRLSSCTRLAAHPDFESWLTTAATP